MMCDRWIVVRRRPGRFCDRGKFVAEGGWLLGRQL